MNSLGSMNTNVQAHTDLIWSVQFDQTLAIAAIAATVVVFVVVIAFARRRKKM